MIGVIIIALWCIIPTQGYSSPSAFCDPYDVRTSSPMTRWNSSYVETNSDLCENMGGCYDDTNRMLSGITTPTCYSQNAGAVDMERMSLKVPFQAGNESLACPSFNVGSTYFGWSIDLWFKLDSSPSANIYGISPQNILVAESSPKAKSFHWVR
jgi:hypothetical protein